MLTNLKITLAVLCLTAFVTNSKAQQGTLEFTSLSSNIVTTGPSTAPVVVTFREDIQNLTVNTHFKTNSPTLTATFSFARQRFTSAYASNVSTGMMFGGGSTAAIGGATQTATSNPLYNALGGTLIQPPQNGMFVSSPTGTIVSNWQAGGRGVGLDPEGTQNGVDDDNFGAGDYSWGTAVYTTVEPLKDSLKDGRYYYGDLVIKFSRTVKNPVIHIGGMGGSYEYINLAAQTLRSYFTTELELDNPGVTSTFMAGNEFFNVVSATNKILNSALSPNGGSYAVGAGTTYGAATGSVRINGTMDSLVYRVYVRGSVNSQFSFSALQANIAGATRNPFNGDLFYVAVSMNKPTQQLSGFVYNDRDGLTDNDVNKSAGLPNIRTNASNGLHANLLNTAGQAVATVPIAANGAFLFDNVPAGTYTVQLTTIASAGTYAVPAAAPATVLPAGWVNTGEFVGSGVGSDGLVNGRSASVIVLAGEIKTEVNFGIERLPDSKNFNSFIALPVIGDVAILNTTGFTPKFGPLPVLTGSDIEDMPIENVLTGKTLRITRLPAFGVLRYNGTPVVLNANITGFNPALLTMQFTAVLNNFVDFQYAYVDAAGLPDPTPATYTLAWSGCCPIFLSEFIANKNECTANLTWKTSTEINGDRFEVEISTVNNVTYSKVGTIAAAGNSSTPKSYSFTYPMQQGVVYYFRLKMIDKDGSFMYSDIRSLSCSKGNGGIVIGPNPTRDIFTVRGMQNGKNKVQVYAANGQLVKEQDFQQNQGDVDISHMAPGIYAVKVTNLISETTVVSKIIKY